MDSSFPSMLICRAGGAGLQHALETAMRGGGFISMLSFVTTLVQTKQRDDSVETYVFVSRDGKTMDCVSNTDLKTKQRRPRSTCMPKEILQNLS